MQNCSFLIGFTVLILMAYDTWYLIVMNRNESVVSRPDMAHLPRVLHSSPVQLASGMFNPKMLHIYIYIWIIALY